MMSSVLPPFFRFTVYISLKAATVRSIMAAAVADRLPSTRYATELYQVGFLSRTVDNVNQSMNFSRLSADSDVNCCELTSNLL